MTKHSPSQPIGIFDSGIGGLTIAHALVKQLPHENIIYFGDTAHLPYGDKSAATIQGYAIKITQLLIEQQCKLILIACNSASAAAYDLIKEYVANKAIVLNVIDPTIQLLKENYSSKTIGLIGTRQTVLSQAYQNKINELNLNIQLIPYATNLLASAIEEFGNNQVIDSLLEEYLAHPPFKNMDALVLACTHYPIIKNKIAHYFNTPSSQSKNIEIIDPSETVAQAVKHCLEQDKLLNASGGKQMKRFYVSDYTSSFAANAKKFFGNEILLEHYPLWE